MDLQGSELKAALERSVSQFPLESGGFLHVSGLKVEFDSSKPANERIVSVKYNNGTDFVEVEDNTTYKSRQTSSRRKVAITTSSSRKRSTRAA